MSNSLWSLQEPHVSANAINASFDGEWVDWHGGECPLNKRDHARVRYRDGEIFRWARPDYLRWHHIGTSGDIVAYQVVKPVYGAVSERQNHERHENRRLSNIMHGLFGVRDE